MATTAKPAPLKAMGKASLPVASTPVSDSKENTDDGVIVDSKSVVGLKATLTKMLSKSGASRPKLAPTTASVCFTTNYTSGAASNNVAITSVEPSVSADWAEYSFLYDEAKVVGGKLRWFAFLTGSANVVSQAVVTYDPVDATVLTSTAQGTTYSQKYCYAFNPVAAVPTAVTASGNHEFNFHVLKGAPARSAVVGDTLFGNEWASTTDTTDVWGYIKHFIPAQGAATTTTIVMSLELKVMFRSRR